MEFKRQRNVKTVKGLAITLLVVFFFIMVISNSSNNKSRDINIDIYRCIGTDNTQYDCDFLIFIKENEIIHISYYGYGDKTTYYTKEKGILRKTVHPYTDN